MLDDLKTRAKNLLEGIRSTKSSAGGVPSSDPSSKVDASLTEVPSGVQLRGNMRAVRLNRKALYLVVASTLGVASYAILSSPEVPQKQPAGDATLKSETTVNTTDAWFNRVPDFFVGPAERAAASMPAGVGMPPPPMTPGAAKGSAPPPLLAGDGTPALTAAPGALGQSTLDVRTARAPMIAWQAGMPVVGGGPLQAGAGAPMGQLAAQQAAQTETPEGTVPLPRSLAPAKGAALTPVGPRAAAQAAVLTPSSRSGAFGQGMTPVSNYEIKAGWLIPGVLIEAINSDSADMVRAQVAENVYDTKTGKHLLIPAGTRLIGAYAAQPAWGAERLQVAWTRMIFPDTTEYDISGMNGSDATGAAGLADQVNNHYGKLATTALLMSVFGVQAQMMAQQNTTVNGQYNANAALSASAGQQVNNTAQMLLQRDARIPPTIEIRAGYRFNIKVHKTVIFNKAYALPAYKGGSPA